MEQDRKLRNKPTHLWSLICDKGQMTKQWRKDILVNKWCWGNWTAMCKKNEIRTLFNNIQKNKFKWIKDINVRPNTVKLLQENIAECSDTKFRISFSHHPPE